jgi:hypothetical protein
MPIVKLESARNLTELAQRLYGLTTGDRRIATAVRALAAANRHLPDDLSRLPPETPIIAPQVEGTRLASGTKSAVPQDVRLLELVRFAGEAVKELVAAAQSGQAPAQASTRAAALERFKAAQAALKLTPEQKPGDREKHAARLKTFSDSVEAFLKMHGG